MADGQQLRLLLWKDYLIRKRKLITLVGILWATAIMLSLYIVRVNINNEDHPTCGYPARALPSAGMLPFLQSFMCTVNNECSPLDKYDELPTYENSKLTQLQRQLAPIFNETVLDVASSMPDAIKLLATLADVVDEPAFIDISKNGLKVKDLFVKPMRVKRYISDKLELDDDVAQSIMDAELSFQGIMKGNMNRCSLKSLNETIIMENEEHLNILMDKLCSKSMEELQKMLIDVLFQVNYSKYVSMLGDMYFKMSGDNRLNTLGNMLTAVLRMMKLQNFLPPEMVSIFQGQEVDFSYVDLSLIPKLLDLFKPTFGDTQSYGIIKDISDAVVVGIQYMDKIFARQRQISTVNNQIAGASSNKQGSFQAVSNLLHNAAGVFEDAMQKDPSIDAFSIMSQVMNFINKFLTAKTKHDIVFYSTLLAKLMESAQKVIDINMHIEQLTYNVTLRNPGAIEVLKGIPPKIVGKAFEALADAERTQILTSKMNFPGQMFCDVYKLQTFFVISKAEAEPLKKQLCTDAWKNYVSDMIRSFGVYEVKSNINNMASLLIQETFGKDTSDQLYSIEQNFRVLKNFTQALVRIDTENRPEVDWNSLFHVPEDSELMKVARAKGHLGKQMLIVIHGAIAKEIVQQNTILDFKISPYLNDVIILVSAINEQLEQTPEGQAKAFKDVYTDVVETMLMTALNEKKAYKALSTTGQEILCNGVEMASEFLELSPDVNTQGKVVESLCNATISIEKGLEADSAVSKAIATIKNSSHPSLTLNWNKLINNLKNLYVKLDRDYTYLFQFSTYNMDEPTKRKIDALLAEAKEYWFGIRNMERSLRLSVKLAFRFLDMLDFGLFDVNGEYWQRIKYAITTTTGPFNVFDETVKLVAALLTNSSYTSELPPTTVAALSSIIPNIPQLIIDAVDIIIKDDTDVQPIISLLNSDPPWPCSTTSLSELLQLTEPSKDAVRGIETILCMNADFQTEWMEYLAVKNVSLNSSSTWNTTDYEPHLFLKFSSTFDSLVDDILLTKDALEYVFNDTTDRRLGMKEAWNYAVKSLNTTERDVVLRKLFTKVDTVLNAVNTSSIPSDVPVSTLWERYSKCSSNMDDECRLLGRKAWQNLFGSLTITLENIASDLLTYFQEVNEPNSNLLQLFGFTRSTGLYMLYDKIPEFMGALLNSYWDYGFMSQVRRASLSQFWDCPALLTAMVPPPGSIVDSAFIEKVQPFVCPSLLHWLSLPRGENTLLDVFSKPQYFFFTLPVSNLTSRFENAYTKALELTDYLTELSKKNQTILTEDDIKMNTIEGKLEKVVDAVLYYKLDETNPTYRLFNEMNMNQFAANIYLTRVVSIINKLYEEINILDIAKINDGTSEETKRVAADLEVIKYLFKRKPSDAVNIHFDILTDVIWTNNENYTLVNAFHKMCDNLKENTSKTLLVTDEKARGQLCAKNYEFIYSAVQNVAVNDYESSRKSLMNLVDILKNEDEDATDVFEVLSRRKQLISVLRTSTQHSYDLSIPIYLKYLQSNIQSYDIILGFLAGEDWWKLLREQYNGPYATKFLGYLENSFDVAEDLLSNFDEIHIVRLLHDIDVNQTESFCLPNITLSDYLPDRTGLWSNMKRQICAGDNTELYRELPPLLFASQGYENSLKLSNDVDYTAVNTDISKIESRLQLIKDGPKSPQNPSWVTEEKVQHLRTVALQLLSKETLAKISFAVMSNGVDAGTLFLNSSQCTVCSQFTTWFKQLNLQLFKKQEYDNLLCHLHTLSLDDVYHALKNDFHWDMAIRELISTRNYTKYEMNKSINEFLGQVKAHLLDDMNAKSTKLGECLASNVSRNEFGNATLFASVLAHTTKLIRAELPHIHEVEGVKDLQYLKELSTEVAHKLDVVKPLKDYLIEKNDLHGELMNIVDDNDVVTDIENAQVNLRKIRSISESNQNIIVPNSGWTVICNQYNCSDITSIIHKNINKTHIDKTLPKYQQDEFWRFTFVSSIIHHIGNFMSHGARLLGLVSKVDVTGMTKGQLEPMLDALLLIISEDAMDNVMYSLQGIVDELHPLLEGLPLEVDLEALSSGLAVVRQLKNYLLVELDLKVEVSKLFTDAEDIELGLSALGINNTNFWSIAAPRIHAGHLQLKPLMSSKPDDSHIGRYVCQMDWMSKVLLPGNLDVVTADDVFGAVTEQFCGLPDDIAKQVLPVLIRNFNFSLIVDKVASTLLTKLYSASNLTEEEGSTVLSQYSQMAALLPMLQENMRDVGTTLANETLFQSLKDFSSVGSLLSSSEFLSSAGSMLCGKPFEMNTNRFYKSIAATQDFSTQPDQAQLDVLPTDFCRSLYVDIINVEGGKIVWSFVKPLIMGKILYTPPTPAVTRIIQKANSTFATMIKMTRLVQSFSASFPAVGKLSSHRDGIAVLRRLVSAPQFRGLREVLLGGADDVAMPEVDVDGLFDEFGDLDSIESLLSKASQLLQCINLDRFKPSPSEDDLSHEAAQLSIVNEFSAGVVFLKSEQLDKSLNNVEYKIRMDIDNAPTTAKLKDYLWIPGPESNFIEHMRYFRGFVQIQDIVDKAIIRLAHNSSRREKRETQQEMDWAVYTQQTPYPCYRKDYFQTSLYESQSLIVAFFFSLLFTVASAVRFIVSDKESGNTMLMSVMGVDLRWHTLSWFLSSCLEMTLTCLSITLVLYLGRILPTTDPSLVFVLLFIFGLAVLSFCYMLSKLFSSASVAAVCAAILYLVSFMPFIIILSLEAVLYSSLKTFICLSMSSSLCYAFLYITRFEAHSAGAGWAQLWEAPGDSDDMSIGLAAVMMLVDAAIYLAIGWTIDRYFGIKTIKSNITYCTTSDEKAGVSIVNISKIYGPRSRRPKLALDNVSIELQKGQITTLLGHNGAGKTTLIKILTGMLRPTSGHVSVRSARARLGVCPQRDVLLEALSAREHVELYARLNTLLPAHRVPHEVDRMLEVLSLGPVSSEPVSRLSGGTRRRLCVALAFIGQPNLVFLDEPTAGVDPAARRDIWSMIVKLKEDRTILMTTHHLDEAELLSDQIVIMHKGQVHTTGSPIEIKRTLGNGYKLTVIYPDRDPDHDEAWEETSQEEKTKQLLTIVRDVVRNANVIDVNGLEVEIGLPFFDVNGISNNFLQVCTVLEAAQAALGFKSYSMDCSSLEQVFFNICQQADAPLNGIEYLTEGTTSKSASSSSIRTDRASQELVPLEGPLKGTAWQQFLALMHARYIHHIRNRWLLFMLVVLPSLFVVVAMGFSMLRPPADNEIALRLDDHLYEGSTEFIVHRPSIYSEHVNPSFAERVLEYLTMDKQTNTWTSEDSPHCECGVIKQQCDVTANQTRLPQMMVLPDADTLNHWLVDTQEIYIEKRYGGFSASVKNNLTNLVAWYNNKGHHAMPAYVNAINNAILKTVARAPGANITTYTHPLKISKEQISKATVYQHIADAGISGLVLLAYCLVSAGAAIYLVGARASREKRLQLLSGVSPLTYWTTALAWDMMVIVINMGITAVVMSAFGFPVFVARNNLPAICLLFVLYGYACGNLIHVAEKVFSEPSIANMVLFCGNAFLGLSFITILLILDIVSESETTDYARSVLHKIFLLSPQFALGDGLLEIAKNTIQAQVLSRFGMDTYKDPLDSSLVLYHYVYLLVVGTLLLLLNLAIEYNCFDTLLARIRPEHIPSSSSELEASEVSAERARVRAARLQAHAPPLTLRTIGNINRGFVHTEGKKNSIQRMVSPCSDAAQCEDLGKVYQTMSGPRLAVANLTLGIPPGQCTALLGQNGAGKSTTFSMLTGEVRPSAGQLYLNNEPVKSTQLCRGLISYCPQSDALDSLMTVNETLQLYCRLRGITDQDEVIKRTVELFELCRYSEVQCGALSGGNRRKLCAALAFMARTPLVLLDEPTSGMDPVSRGCVSRGVRVALGGARGGARGVLLSTHALADARRLAARVALLRAGRLVALAPLDDCLTRFGGGYVVACRVGRGAAGAWRRVTSRAPHARLRVLHQRELHFLIPSHTTVDKKEVTTRLSDIFRLMAELQGTCDIEDYTINQSSLEQMFLSFTDKLDVPDTVEVEPLPTPAAIRHTDDLDTVTSL